MQLGILERQRNAALGAFAPSHRATAAPTSRCALYDCAVQPKCPARPPLSLALTLAAHPRPPGRRLAAAPQRPQTLSTTSQTRLTTVMLRLEWFWGRHPLRNCIPNTPRATYQRADPPTHSLLWRAAGAGAKRPMFHQFLARRSAAVDHASHLRRLKHHEAQHHDGSFVYSHVTRSASNAVDCASRFQNGE